jgi:hypothetical protein
MSDCKLYGDKTTEMIYAEIKDRLVFSIDDSVLKLKDKSPILKVFEELYPVKSKHEIN